MTSSKKRDIVAAREEGANNEQSRRGESADDDDVSPHIAQFIKFLVEQALKSWERDGDSKR
jgi:hypothetical protein